jgi:carbonic anhydrase
MEKLVHGIHRFRETVFRSERELYQRLASGQEPDTLFITCSDSRIVPSELTQTKPGELFIVRNAGNIVPPFRPEVPAGSEVAAVEFAIDALKVKDIVVCGHSHCGAVMAIVDPEKATSLPRVAQWLERNAGDTPIGSWNRPDRASYRPPRRTSKRPVSDRRVSAASWWNRAGANLRDGERCRVGRDGTARDGSRDRRCPARGSLGRGSGSCDLDRAQSSKLSRSPASPRSPLRRRRRQPARSRLFRRTLAISAPPTLAFTG